MKSLEKTPGWDDFVEDLANKGFFQGEKIDSPMHKSLMAQAADAFRKTEKYQQHRMQAEAPAERILDLLQREYDPLKVRLTVI